MPDKDKKITETPTEGVADTQVVTTTAELKEAVGEVMQAKVDELGEQLGEQLQATVKEQFATVEERVEELREELREGLKEGLQAAQATGTPNEAEPAPTAPEPALTPAATSENLPEPIKEAIVTAVESKAAVTAEETKVQVAEEIHKQLEEIQSAAAQPETLATSNNHVTHKLIDVNKDQVKRSHSTLVGIIVVETLIIIGLGVYSAFLQEKNNSLKAAPVPGLVDLLNPGKADPVGSNKTETISFPDSYKQIAGKHLKILQDKPVGDRGIKKTLEEILNTDQISQLVDTNVEAQKKGGLSDSQATAEAFRQENLVTAIVAQLPPELKEVKNIDAAIRSELYRIAACVNDPRLQELIKN